MKTIQAILFDMDGTLVDSERVGQKAWAATADEMGIEIPDDLVRAFIGRPSQSCRAMLAEHLGGDADLANRVFDLHIELFLKFVETDLELKPGAIEVLEALKAAGFPLAIATSTARVRALPRLERFDMLKYFDSITCGDEIENGKPAPDIFVESARRLGCDPALCAVIEDSHNGVRSGHASGARVFMIPDIVAPTPEIEKMCAAVLPTLHELPAAIAAVNDSPAPRRA